MAVYQLDEYAESQRRGGPRTSAWLLWIVATLVGALVARILALGLDRVEEFSGPLYIGYLLARGAVVGAILGAAQGLVFLFFTRKSAVGRWVLATATGWAARSMVLFLISDAMLNLFKGFSEPGIVAASGLTGAVLGAALAIPQAVALRGYVEYPVWWVWLNVVAALVGRVVAALGLVSGLVSSPTVLIVIEFTVTAALTGLILIDMLRRAHMQTNAPPPEAFSAAPQPVIHPMGQNVNLAHGLFLTFNQAEVTPNSIVWHGAATNITGNNLKLPLTSQMLSVNDSTHKPYAISGLTTSDSQVPAGGSAEIVVTAMVLPYSPVPPGVSYVDLAIDQDTTGVTVFRQYL